MLRTRLSTLQVLLTAALVAAVLVFATGPDRPARTPVPASPRAPTLRGAFHLHTTRSDGAMDKAQVALAAARAGMQFAIFTDHGDGTRPPDRPEYLHGVLCIDAVEISSDDGHYLALGMAQAPYPLGGDGAAVVEDVSRLGGFGVAAHPFSPRAELSWTDWSAPLDGVEWLNADSEWRDEGRLPITRALLDYLWRPAGALASLLDRPVALLEKWDQLASGRRVLALAGHDAHGGLGNEAGERRGRRLHVPSYEATFRTFSLHVTLAGPPSGQPEEDARLLVEAIRGGRLFTVVDAVAGPGSLVFTASQQAVVAGPGGELPPGSEPARFVVRADVPAGATTILMRGGVAIGERSGGVLDHVDNAAGAYRVEVRVPGAPGEPPIPWLVSNPIFKFAGAQPAAAAAPPVPVASLMDRAWRAEHSRGSTAAVSAAGASVGLTFALAAGPEASQFAALVADLEPVPGDYSMIVFRARAATPMRLSAQLRFGADGGVRWRRSFYADGTDREVRIPIAQLRPADRSGSRPAPGRASSLLLVVDLTNAAPGAQGSLTIRDAVLAR